MLFPSVVEFFDKLDGVGLSFPFCRKGIERHVSHLSALENVPAIAPLLLKVGLNLDCEGVNFWHDRTMRQRRRGF